MKYTDAVRLHKNGSLVKRSGTRDRTVKDTFTRYIDYQTKYLRVDVSEGYETDLGTIPRYLRRLFNPTAYVAYILHDYLYTDGVIISKDDKPFFYSRRDADVIMYSALVVEGMPRRKAYLVYKAVRIFGFFYIR